MKNLIKLLFISLIVFSCENAYEIGPDDEILEENTFNSVEDLERGIYGVYAGISGTNVIGWSSRFTDDLRLSPENRGQGVQVHTWSIVSGTNEAAALWQNLYNVIVRCNRLLEASETVTANNDDEVALKERIKAESLAVRALCHFELYRLFSQDYEASSLSVPIVQDVLVFEQPPRDTVGDVIAFINTDLQDAYGLLDESYTDNTRFTKSAITALRARVALYAGELDDAITYSTEIIDNHALASTSEFSDVWLDNSNTEVLFKLSRTSGDGAVGTLFQDTNGDVFFNMSYSLVEHIFNYGWTGDIRTFTTIDVANYDYNNVLVGKYLGNAANFGLNDIKMFRVGEQYLIRAEAYARDNELGLASDDIEALRNARKFSPVAVNYTNQDVALEDILGERRMELAYEGHRFFDLKRFNQGVSRWAEDCELAAGACDLDANDYRFTLPIPQSELFANDNMVQNNDY